mgnify:CR=1 FL=1
MKNTKLERLKNNITETLSNKICNVQSLDISADRKRVNKELIKMLTKKYTIYEKHTKQTKTKK